jgi:GTP pyrophosphokinase
MVKIREHHPLEERGGIDIEAWLTAVQVKNSFAQEQIGLLRSACQLSFDAEQARTESDKRWADTSCFHTGLEMATILNDLDQDVETLVAAILYRAVREERLPLSQVEERFGQGVAKLIEGVLRMASISTLQSLSEERVLGRAAEVQVENLRKMLVAVIDDVRVALVKIAERTCAIRAAKNAPDAKRRRVAHEIMSVYAPLAHRLGIGHLKWELEDVAFRYLEPDAYKRIARLLDERRLDRQQFIVQARTQLGDALSAAGIEAEISGRAKHIYSIWRKMRAKGIGFSQVYDIRALRVLVPNIQDCYTALGIVHGLWRNIPNEFDDYIANPKENGYRSLHTAVIGPEGKVLEVQIRTFDMHKAAEFGVCAHWQYKGADKTSHQDSYDAKIEWLRQVLAWHEETGGNLELVKELKADIVQDRIYVFTPEGHVIDLPSGATALDFAYHIHTGVGHRCRGCRINGRVVPLYQPLNTGDQVEIITGKREAPSRDWLTSGLEYLHTARARSRVQHWFRQQALDENIESGRLILDRVFQRLALSTQLDLEALSKTLEQKSLSDLYAAVGTGELSMTAVLHAAMQAGIGGQQADLPLDWSSQTDALPTPVIGAEQHAVRLASCCTPVEGDVIIGVIGADNAVSVHQQSCEQALQVQLDHPEQILLVSWGSNRRQTFPVSVAVRAYERRGLLRDISSLLDSEEANVIRLDTVTEKQTNLVEMNITLEVENFQQLSRLLEAINQIPNVYQALRQT